MSKKTPIQLEGGGYPDERLIVSSSRVFGRISRVHMSVAKGYQADGKGYGGNLTKCGKFLSHPEGVTATRQNVIYFSGADMHKSIVLCEDCGTVQDFLAFADGWDAKRAAIEEERIRRWDDEARDRDIEDNWRQLWNGLAMNATLAFNEAVQDDELLSITASELRDMLYLGRDEPSRLYGIDRRGEVENA